MVSTEGLTLLTIELRFGLLCTAVGLLLESKRHDQAAVWPAGEPVFPLLLGDNDLAACPLWPPPWPCRRVSLMIELNLEVSAATLLEGTDMETLAAFLP